MKKNSIIRVWVLLLILILINLSSTKAFAENLQDTYSQEDNLLRYGDVIALQSASLRNYLSCSSGMEAADVILMMNANEYEYWMIIDSANPSSVDPVKFNDTVILKSVKWGNYLATSGSVNTDVVLQTNLSLNEKWKILDITNPKSTSTVKADNGLLLKSMKWGNYLTGKTSGNNATVILSSNINNYAKWLILPKNHMDKPIVDDVIRYGDTINIKSSMLKNYLSVSSNWQIINFDQPESTVPVRYGDKILLYSTNSGYFLSASSSGNDVQVPLVNKPGSGEVWTIINHDNPAATDIAKLCDLVLIQSYRYQNYLSARDAGNSINAMLMGTANDREEWFITSNYYIRNWMALTPEIKNKYLSEITFPASHDSGTWSFVNEMATEKENEQLRTLLPIISDMIDALTTIKFENDVKDIEFTFDPLCMRALRDTSINYFYEATKKLSICTDINITNQLDLGIRWLDLRVFLKGDSAYIHHFLTGPSMNEIMGSIQNFLDTTNGEILFVEMTHFVPDNADENYNKFINEVRSELGAYAYCKEYDADGKIINNPFNMKYKQVVGDNASSKVILVFDGEPDNIPASADSMFWTYDQLELKAGDYDYANKTDRELMIKDQLDKFNNAKITGDTYTLWYTLTTNGSDGMTIVSRSIVKNLGDDLVSIMTDWIPGWIWDIPYIDVRGTIRSFVQDTIDEYMPAGDCDYTSTKELSQRINYDLHKVLAERFQSTSEGQNHITVIYADFINETCLTELAIEYSRLHGKK